MRNRAKCNLCKTIIESYAMGDYVMCPCGEIAIDGGLDKLLTYARSYDNFKRVDDNDHEIDVTVSNSDKLDVPLQSSANNPPSPTIDDFFKAFEELIKVYQNLPKHAMNSPCNHSDILSLLELILASMRALRASLAPSCAASIIDKTDAV
jgi:hypothetical protein